MKNIIYLSLVTIALLNAEENLGDIDVNERVDSQTIADVSGEQIKSSDLAEALERNSPSITIIRRSGIANDILLRGQKRDNINVTVDGMKIYGAGPNRMDPPTAHVMTQNIDGIEITQGAFDVEDFGTLSGKIKIKTVKPSKEFKGEVDLNMGSFNYKKAMVRASGGNDKVRILVSASKEQGGQYEDGDGHTFAEQLDAQIAKNPSLAGNGYQTQERGKDAYSRTSAMAKIFWDITPDQELQLSYTGNRSDNILYPNTPMDAIVDDSNLYNAIYTIKNLGTASKKLELQAYQTDVYHPMSNQYRKASQTSGVVTKHSLNSKMQGAKIKNSFDVQTHQMMIGVDYSKRNWDGAFYKNDNPAPAAAFHSIYDVNTKNHALFLKDKVNIAQAEVSMGLRYDDTSVTNGGGQQNNDYSSLTGNVFVTFKPTDDFKYYLAVGKSTRVPDGRELYFHKSGNAIGTPNLKQTSNYEADVGFEKSFESGLLKSKFYYSKLKDYIYYNAQKSTNVFENIDAHIYGAELSGSYFATDALFFDYSATYTVGKKDTLATNQTDRDLSDIAPLKMVLATNYEFENSSARLEMVARDRWDTIDAENGEQTLPAYAVFNAKWQSDVTNSLNITLGVDNIFDKTYAISNTQSDLTLIGGSETMLMNEPGRYVYLNAKYAF